MLPQQRVRIFLQGARKSLIGEVVPAPLSPFGEARFATDVTPKYFDPSGCGRAREAINRDPKHSPKIPTA